MRVDVSRKFDNVLQIFRVDRLSEKELGYLMTRKESRLPPWWHEEPTHFEKSMYSYLEMRIAHRKATDTW